MRNAVFAAFALLSCRQLPQLDSGPSTTGATPPTDTPTDSSTHTTDSSDPTTTKPTTPTEPWSASVVVLITIDTVSRDFLGRFHPQWDTTPHLDALFAESTLFSNTVVVRSFTKPSLLSMHTGMYPRTTRVRDNYDVWKNQVPDLFEVFKDAGYYTYGFSTNMCELLDYNVDERSCISVGDLPADATQQNSDQQEVDKLITALEKRPADKPLFIRLHLMDPHDPYNAVEDYYNEFHPTKYTGDFNPASPDDIEEATLDAERLSAADINHLHAAYASQLKSTDAMIGQFLDALKDMDLYDDALIVYGSDHGDELAVRSDYVYHGCSFYNSVMLSAYSFRAPGLPAAQTIDAWVSTTDIAPTIYQLAGLKTPEQVEGQSLVDHIQDGTSPDWPVFFERGVFTAGVVHDGYKFVLNPSGPFSQCAPYNSGNAQSYPNAVLEIYDLAADPDELQNLQSAPPAAAAALREPLCTWVTQTTWQTDKTDPRNEMVMGCVNYLAEAQALPQP